MWEELVHLRDAQTYLEPLADPVLISIHELEVYEVQVGVAIIPTERHM